MGKKISKGGAIINCANEQFIMISSTTCLTSHDSLTTNKTEHNMGMLDAISKSGLQLLIGDKLTINRTDAFEGIRVKLAEVSYDYEAVDEPQIQFEAVAPRRTVASFNGAYSSIAGDFIVSCSNHSRRCGYFGGTFNKESNSLFMQNFHSNVAKPLHNMIVAMPELNPVMVATALGEDFEILLPCEISDKYEHDTKLAVRVELSAIPTSIGSVQVVGVINNM